MKTLEDSLLRRLIMLASYLMFQTGALLDDDKGKALPLWLRVALRLKVNIQHDQLGLVAAGVAFYFLLAAFPALAVLVSLYALVADPVTMATQMHMLSRFLPPEPLAILTDQVIKIGIEQEGTLSLSLIFSFLFTFYIASKGMRVLLKGFNIAYDYEEKRNLLWRSLLAYALTVGMIVYMFISLVVIAGIPAFLQIMPFPDQLNTAYLWLRWPGLFFVALVGLEFLYSWGPAAPEKNWRLFSAGSLTATALWVTVSSLFSLFVAHFGRYNETYGSISAVVVLLLWFWISAVMILLGAEINAAIAREKEHGQPGAPVRS